MPLPKLTEKIIASSKPLEVGWSLFTLKETRATAAKSGKGTNYFFDFEADCGPNSSEDNKGRSATLMINGTGLEAGIAEVCAAYYGMLSALTGLSANELTNQALDENALVGKKMWAEVKHRIVEGKTFLDWTQFSPASEMPF